MDFGGTDNNIFFCFFGKILKIFPNAIRFLSLNFCGCMQKNGIELCCFGIMELTFDEYKCTCQCICFLFWLPHVKLFCIVRQNCLKSLISALKLYCTILKFYGIFSKDGLKITSNFLMERSLRLCNSLMQNIIVYIKILKQEGKV